MRIWGGTEEVTGIAFGMVQSGPRIVAQSATERNGKSRTLGDEREYKNVTEQPESFSGLAGLFMIEQPDWLLKDCIILCGLEIVKPSISNLKSSTGTFSNLGRSHQPEKVTRNLLGPDFVYYTLFGHEMFA